MSSNSVRAVTVALRHQRIDTRARTPHPVLATTVFVMLVALLLVPVAGAHDVLFLGVMVAVLAFFALFMLPILQMAFTARKKIIHMRSRGPLTFLPTRFMRWAWPAAGGAALLAAVLVIISWFVPNTMNWGLRGFIIIAAGGWAFFWQLATTRFRPGLTLDPEGIAFPRRLFNIEWDELEIVLLSRYGRGETLKLFTYSGDIVTVYASDIGTNPHLIAEVIEHFRTHRERRAILSEPLDALAEVFVFERRSSEAGPQ